MNWGIVIQVVTAIFVAGMVYANHKTTAARTRQHDRDLYHGDLGKAGLMTRMEVAENRIDGLEEHGLRPAGWGR